MAGTSVRWAQPGRETVAAVAAAVRELQGPNPLRSVIVVTPPGSTASTLRRLLPSIDGRGIAGIRFTTVPDLALDLSPAEVRRRRPVTPLLLTAAVHEQLEHHCPSVLAGVRRHPATVDVLVQAADRLRAVTIADDQAAVAEGLAQGSDVRRALVSVAVAARGRSSSAATATSRRCSPPPRRRWRVAPRCPRRSWSSPPIRSTRPSCR